MGQPHHRCCSAVLFGQRPPAVGPDPGAEGEHELGVHQVPVYHPAAALDHIVRAAADAFALDALPRRQAVHGWGSRLADRTVASA